MTQCVMNIITQTRTFVNSQVVGDGGLAVKIHPSLGHAALSQKQDRAYRLWLLARSLDAAGRGQIRICDLLAAVDILGLRGLSRFSVSRILADGEPIWWDTFDRDGESWVSLRGLGNVTAALGVEFLTRPVIVILPMTLKHFRALCVFSVAGPRVERRKRHKKDANKPKAEKPKVRGRTIAQSTLSDLTGKTSRTIRGYRQALGRGLDIKKNAGLTGQSMRRWKRGDPVPDGYFVDIGPDGEPHLFRYLPNTYLLFARVGARGMTKKVNRGLGNSCDTLAQEEQKPRRLYHEHTTAINRRIQMGIEGDRFLLLTPFQTRGHWRLWLQYQFVGGLLCAGS